MNEEFEEYVMRPGDVFVAEECGCSFTVNSGPYTEAVVRQCPECCCGHTMVKRNNHVNGAMTTNTLEAGNPDNWNSPIYGVH